MIELSEEPKYDPRNHVKPQTSSWRIYMRLLGYAWKYKLRLVVSLLFAVIVAGSFSSMIFGVAAVIDVVFSVPDAPSAEIAATESAADRESRALDHLSGRYLPSAKRALNTLRVLVPWDEEQDEQKLRSLLTAMRANEMTALKIVCSVVFITIVLAGLARFLQEYFAGTIGANISVTLARQMYENVMGLSLGFFERHSTGELLARFTNDIFQVNRGLASAFVKLMREPIKALFFLGVALKADPLLTLVGLCVLPPVVAVMYRLGKKFKKSVRRSLEKIASLASVANETFSGITIVKGFCMESYEIKRTTAELDKLRRYLYRMVKVDATVGPLVELVLMAGVVLLVLFAGKRVIDERMAADNLFQLVTALALILDPVRKLSTVNNLIQTSVASAERVFEFIDWKPEIVEKANAAELPAMKESIRFEDVRFAYKEGVDVLKGLSFEVKKGQMVALVGFSGAGKSTIAKLIPRFYDASAGAIKIDGVDIRDVTFASLRAQISIVTQDTILFNESVRDNIAFGQTKYSEERVRAAAKAAHAVDFIEELPNGYDAVIGESGSTLSGGQRQRLAIARAIIKDPAILVLDEATSNLDSQSEQAIQQALEEFVVGRTTIVIAHRLSTVQRADRIVVLDRGEIAEEGTHKELLEKGGIYSRLYEQQFLGDGNRA